MYTLTHTSVLALALVGLLIGAAATAGATSNHLGIAAEASDAEAGDTTTISITFSNDGDEGTGAIVAVTGIPNGWEIENRSDDGGSWNSGESKWLFQRVEAGGSVAPSLTLSIPDDATGDHEIEIRGSTTEMNVTTTVTVSLGGGDETEESDEEDGDDEGTSASGPGFGVGIAALAVLGLALLALRRQ